MKTDVAESATYQQVLESVRRLSVEEQLALVADIATTLRNYSGDIMNFEMAADLASVADIAAALREAVRTNDEVAETAYLAESPTFQRLVEQGLRQIREGKTRRVEELLSEL